MHVARFIPLHLIVLFSLFAAAKSPNVKPLPPAHKNVTDAKPLESSHGSIDDAKPLTSEEAPIDEATPFPPAPDEPQVEEKLPATATPFQNAETKAIESKPSEPPPALDEGKSVDIKYRGNTYQLSLVHGILYAKNKDKSYKGKLEKGLRDFSHWTFAITKDNEDPYGFEVIINEKTLEIIYQKDGLEAGGPFLVMVSHDSKMLLIDFGIGSGIRNFEVRAPSGKLLLKDDYFDKNDPRFKDGMLLYEHPEAQLELDQNDQTKACEDVGTPWEIVPYKYDGHAKQKDVAGKSRIECTN